MRIHLIGQQKSVYDLIRSEPYRTCHYYAGILEADEKSTAACLSALATLKKIKRAKYTTNRAEDINPVTHKRVRLFHYWLPSQPAPKMADASIQIVERVGVGGVGGGEGGKNSGGGLFVYSGGGGGNGLDYGAGGGSGRHEQIVKPSLPNWERCAKQTRVKKIGFWGGLVALFTGERLYRGV
jgi:hypothetical protein